MELARKVDQSTIYGLTAPLITTSDGKKMGKTAAGAIWLNKDLLSEYDYWQFWRNVDDADVIRFLKLFTEVPLAEINEMESKWTGAELNQAKVRLADEATTMLHGSECLKTIHDTVASLFGSDGGSNLDSLDKIVLDNSVSADLINNKVTVSVVDLLIKAGMATSKGEAKRLIKAGGARINDEKVIDENLGVTMTNFDSEGRLKLSSGKKKHALIVLTK